ncbi:MAG: hypothetical protein Q9190_004992 [Brigantiaea leucoxantha]
MNCQKCRTPLKLDNSLQDLNSAAFDLLVGSSSQSIEPSSITSRTPYPSDRKELYDKVSQNASSPVFKRVIPPARQGLGSQPAMAASTKAGLKDNPAMSFVMLTDSQVVPPQSFVNGKETSNMKGNPKLGDTPSDSKQSLSHQVEATTRLFEILSSRSDIDHPICTECTDLLLSSLQSRLSSATKERDAYISFLKTLNSKQPTTAEVTRAQKSLEAARATEAKAFSELVALENEKAALDAEIASLEAESQALDSQEKDFWRSRNSFTLALSEFQNERDALTAAYEHDAQQLERLQRTNIYNDCFCISHDGHFGTINGLRLGRLAPPQNVDWAEINAAWGTAALLLNTVAEKLNFQFKGYRIRPMGSTSKIEYTPPASSAPPSSQQQKKQQQQQQPPTNTTSSSSPSQQKQSQSQPHQKPTILDLFSSGDLPLGRMLVHRRLDAGMVAFLDCIKQLGEFVESGGGGGRGHHVSPNNPPSSSPRSGGGAGAVVAAAGILKLPYQIRKDKIGDASIRLGASTDEVWTRACKYALTCCKFLLAHASNVGASTGQGHAKIGGSR